MANTPAAKKLAEPQLVSLTPRVHVAAVSRACCFISFPKPWRRLRGPHATQAKQRCRGCCRRWGWRSRPASAPFGSPLEGENKIESCEKGRRRTPLVSSPPFKGRTNILRDFYYSTVLFFAAAKREYWVGLGLLQCQSWDG